MPSKDKVLIALVEKQAQLFDIDATSESENKRIEIFKKISMYREKLRSEGK